MAFFDWLFGSDDPAPVNTSSHSVSTVPEYITGPATRMMAAGEQLVGQPYQPYDGPRIADMTPDELAAMQRSRDIAGQGAGQIGQGYGVAAMGADPITGDEISGYMNPYLDTVAGQTIRELQRNQSIQTMEDRANAVAQGAFGGDREAILQGMRERDLGQNIADVTERTMAGGYDRALQQAQQQREQQLRTGLGLGQLGAQEQNVALQDINQQYAMGLGQRQFDQSQLDLSYDDFTQQQEYPYQQLSFLSSLITGAAGSAPRTTTTTGTQPGAQQPGVLQTVGGLGLAGLGTAANLGWKPFA